ncbi:MAG: hypothetical protein QMD09_11510 [Desulfatibacillaceae bacterium]|nr:hypothetical protein [Desulfatibacillaceae bacterium]
METAALLHELKMLCEKLGVTVSERVLKSGAIRVTSGLCVVRGEARLILDRKLPDDEKVDILLENLARIPMDSVFVIPHLRERIDSFRESNKIVPAATVLEAATAKPAE